MMFDKSGKPIKAGDLIAYGKALGRCAGLQYGKVLYLSESEPDWEGKTKSKVRFIGVEEWDGEITGGLQSPSTLAFGSRMLVVTREQVSEKALKLLDAVNIKDYRR